MPGDVTLDLNSAMVKSQFRSALDSVASTLAEYPSTYIDVYGHTDSTGSDSYNQGLSERRAASVADYLAGRGIQRARMATLGYGESQLKCSPERGEADYQCNRRVEIRSEEHTSELQSLMRISYAVFCLKQKKKKNTITRNT